MLGCLVVGILVVIAFANVPLVWWPVLVIVLVVLFVVAAALGLLRGILGTIFGRRD